MRIAARERRQERCSLERNLLPTGGESKGESMSKYWVRFVTLIVFLFVRQGHLLAQIASQEPTGQRCSFSGVYQEAGWEIPGLLGAVPIGPRAAVVYRIDGIEDPRMAGVFSTTLKAGKTRSNQILLHCSNDDSGRLIARFVPVKALEMRRFDFNGRVFAYGITYEVELPGPGGLRSSLESAPVIFYDSEGNGHFTLLRYVPSSVFRSLEVPEWAKKGSK